MEWGDITPLRTKTIRLLEGDLFVIVVNAHGLQTDNATSYCMEELRPTGMALATMRARMGSAGDGEHLALHHTKAQTQGK